MKIIVTEQFDFTHPSAAVSCCYAGPDTLTVTREIGEYGIKLGRATAVKDGKTLAPKAAKPRANGKTSDNGKSNPVDRTDGADNDRPADIDTTKVGAGE